MATATAGQKVRASTINNLPYTVAIGGQLLVNTSGNVTNASEVAVATTPILTLAASTWYQVDFDLYYQSTIAGDVIIARIRDTNILGTQRIAIVAPAVLVNGGGPYSIRATYMFQTTSSPSPTNWVGTIIRSSGSGNCTATPGTRLMVSQLPASATITTV